jgi:hypothetical protein
MRTFYDDGRKVGGMGGVDLREALNWALLDSPLVFVYLAGVVWALLTWPRHPAVSLLAALGLGLLAFTAVVWPFLYTIVPSLYYGNSPTSSLDDPTWSDEPGAFGIFKLLSLLHSMVDAAAMLLVILALFLWRRPVERWAPTAPPPGTVPSVDR